MPIVAAVSKKRCYVRPKLDLGDMARPTKQNFSTNLKRLMDDSGLDGKEFAKKIRKTPETVSRWRSGRMAPSFEDMDAIAAILGVPVHALFEDPTEPASIGMDAEKAIRVLQAAISRGRGN